MPQTPNRKRHQALLAALNGYVGILKTSGPRVPVTRFQWTANNQLACEAPYQSDERVERSNAMFRQTLTPSSFILMRSLRWHRISSDTKKRLLIWQCHLAWNWPITNRQLHIWKRIFLEITLECKSLSLHFSFEHCQIVHRKMSCSMTSSGSSKQSQL